MTELGRKFDGDKLRWDLFPFKALESTVRVLMMGSAKYEDNNWKYVKGCKKRYYSAAMRHLTDWYEGESIDPESGETHLAHALCCIIFLAWHELHQTEEFLEDEKSEEYAKVRDNEISQPPPLPNFDDQRRSMIDAEDVANRDDRTLEDIEFFGQTSPLRSNPPPLHSTLHPEINWPNFEDPGYPSDVEFEQLVDGAYNSRLNRGANPPDPNARPATTPADDIVAGRADKTITLKIETGPTENDHPLLDDVIARTREWFKNFKSNRG